MIYILLSWILLGFYASAMGFGWQFLYLSGAAFLSVLIVAAYIFIEGAIVALRNMRRPR